MFTSKIPVNYPYHYYESEISCEGSDKLVDISIHKNCNVGMHFHEFYEINIVANGSGCHYIGNVAIPINSGEVFVIPPDVNHGYLCEEGLDVVHILLKKAFVEKYYNDLSKIPGYSTLFEIEPYLRQIYDRHLFLNLDKKTLEYVKNKIYNIQKYSDCQYEAYQNVYTLNFLCELCLEMYRQKQRNNGDNDDDKEILHVLEYIQGHYTEKITIEDLMKISNMSRATLHRYFKKVTHTTPAQYIINLRLCAARTQLSNQSVTRTEIAQKYGFYDTSHLNKYLTKK